MLLSLYNLLLCAMLLGYTSAYDVEVLNVLVLNKWRAVCIVCCLLFDVHSTKSIESDTCSLMSNV